MAMSSLSKESLQFIADWAEVLTVVLALASAFFGFVMVFANKPLRKMAELEAKSERIKAAEAHARELEAQIKLDQWLAKKVIARFADPQDFEPLQKFPPGKVDVRYKQGDGEAFMYAQTILQAFRGMHWTAAQIATPTTQHPVQGNEGNPIIGTFVISQHQIDAKEIFEQMKLPVSERALPYVLAGAVKGQLLANPKVPSDTVIIVVGEYLRDWTP